MKCAADFRSIARQALSGRWKIAVIAGLIAAILGGVDTNGLEISFDHNESGVNVGVDFAGQQITTANSGLSEEVLGVLLGGAAFFAIVALVVAVAFFVLGSVVGVGYARFNLDLIDRQKEPEIGTLFGYFTYWRTTAAASFLRGLYVVLWSLLLLVPGIIASYSYAMTGYILAENPEMTAGEAIERSKEMMSGNRWRLFCLQISFIGWGILCALTLGIGNLWLTPYKQAAEAAFYREVSGAEYIPE